MNNKGFSLFELIAVIIVIGVIATVALPSVSNFMDKGSLTTFLTYEKSMEDAATNAVLDCIGNSSTKCDVPEKGRVDFIKLDYLISEGFIDGIKAPDGGTCDTKKSFVRVENKGNLNYKFKVCLYCDGYTTDDSICSEVE